MGGLFLVAVSTLSRSGCSPFAHIQCDFSLGKSLRPTIQAHIGGPRSPNHGGLYRVQMGSEGGESRWDGCTCKCIRMRT